MLWLVLVGRIHFVLSVASFRSQGEKNEFIYQFIYSIQILESFGDRCEQVAVVSFLNVLLAYLSYQCCLKNRREALGRLVALSAQIAVIVSDEEANHKLPEGTRPNQQNTSS